MKCGPTVYSYQLTQFVLVIVSRVGHRLLNFCYHLPGHMHSCAMHYLHLLVSSQAAGETVWKFAKAVESVSCHCWSSFMPLTSFPLTSPEKEEDIQKPASHMLLGICLSCFWIIFTAGAGFLIHFFKKNNNKETSPACDKRFFPPPLTPTSLETCF